MSRRLIAQRCGQWLLDCCAGGVAPKGCAHQQRQLGARRVPWGTYCAGMGACGEVAGLWRQQRRAHVRAQMSCMSSGAAGAHVQEMCRTGTCQGYSAACRVTSLWRQGRRGRRGARCGGARGARACPAAGAFGCDARGGGLAPGGAGGAGQPAGGGCCAGGGLSLKPHVRRPPPIAGGGQVWRRTQRYCLL